MKRACIVDCFSGISGDMTVGAFLDAGMDFKHLECELGKLSLRSFSISKRRVKRKALCGTKFTVHTKKKKSHHHHHHHHVSFSDIKKLLKGSKLDKDIIAHSLAIFTTLAHAEAAVHGVKPGAVHFHEVGAVDSIVDIVSIAICLAYFNIEKVYVKNIHVGSGCVESASHGSFPLPAPATLQLLEGYPLTFTDVKQELVTPTGAAFIAACGEKGVAPFSCVVDATGYGAGDHTSDTRANMVRISIVHSSIALEEEEMMVLETNIDDMPSLVYEVLFERLFACGARDVFCTPIMMKKNRPAYMLSVLFKPQDEARIVETIFKETSTIGVRFVPVRRTVLPREIISLKTSFGMVKAKVVTLSDAGKKAYPEYESCKKIAMRKDLPFRVVYEEAERALGDMARIKDKVY